MSRLVPTMTQIYKPRPARWPQVSLKALFVLVTVLGVCLGWLGVQLKWIRDRHEALKESYVQSVPGHSRSRPAPWSIRVLGEQNIYMIMVKIPKHSEHQVDAGKRLKQLFPETLILIRNWQSPSKPWIDFDEMTLHNSRAKRP